jgi:hypothetical protein
VKWERYWVPLGLAISTEPGGFLLDPKGFFQPASGSLKTLDELCDLPFVVLCGEPASGGFLSAASVIVNDPALLH